MPIVNPNTPACQRVRVMNTKSSRYLSVQADCVNNEDCSLTINDLLGGDILSSTQVWTILQYRSGNYILINQYSGYLAGIRSRSTDNGATANQYPCQLPIAVFQTWSFSQLQNQNWLIRNVNSGKYIGPHNRDISNGNYIIQWDDQSSDDPYQEWQFSSI
jgi:hypothetical protein